MAAASIESLAGSSLLRGVDVLEVSTGIAAAYAGRLLASMGARVRRFGPGLQLAASPEGAPLAERWLHLGKECDTSAAYPAPQEAVQGAQLIVAELDTVHPAAHDWARHVVSHARGLARPPVVVTVRAGALAGATVPGTALTSSAWSATSWSMGDADKAPLSLPYDLADYQAAIQACAAGLCVLLADPADPALRQVDVAGRDVLAYYVGMITANFLPYERPWARDGARPPGSAGVYPASIFACQDGHVVLMCRSPREWQQLLAGMGNPAWSTDPRFADPRVIARWYADEADKYLLPWIAAQTTAELTDFGRRFGLPVAAVRSVAEALDEPQLGHRQFLTALSGAPGTLRTTTQPWQLKATATIDAAPGPIRPSPARAAGPGRADQLLAGLRVLDLSWVWSGPMVTSVLADLGAEVLKIEHAGHLDTGRHRGRARRNGVEVDGPEHEATPYFNQMNHGKRSVTLDLKQPQGREILLRLAERCDIVVENMRPGALAKQGIGYPQLAARNPGLVMLSMSMAGQTGPLASMKGYAGIMAAMSGLESLIGYDEDHIVGSLTPALGDPNAAGHALSVLFAALHRRRTTGHGAWIDLAQVEALMSVLSVPIIESQLPTGAEVLVNRHPRLVPHGHFPCRGHDQWIAIAVRTGKDWASLVDLVRTGPVATTQEWSDPQKRLVDRDDLEAALAAWTATQERDNLVAALLDRGVAAAPVNSFEDLIAAEWPADRHLTVDVAHPYLGATAVFTVPWQFGDQSPGIARPAPLLGADTEAVLTELLAMSADEIQDLKESGVLR